jgi:heavy metal sensor kinase
VMRISIRTRIVVYFVGLTAVLLVAFGDMLFLEVRRSLLRGIDTDLRARATALAALVEREGDSWEVELEGATQPSRDLVRNLTAWTVQTHPEAMPLLRSDSATVLDTLETPGLAGLGGSEVSGGVRPLELAGRFETLAGRSGRAFVGIFAVRDEREADEEEEGGGSAEAPHEGGLDPALVRIAVVGDLAPLEATMRVLLGTLAAIGFVVFLLAAGAGLLLSRPIVRPLTRIAEDAEAVRPTERFREIQGSGAGDEIDRLTATLNRAFTRLHEAFERQTRFTADASHELRTPVATIRSQAEVALRRERTAEAYRETLAVVASEAERLGELLEALLMLARFDSGKLETRMEKARLDEIVRDTLAEFTPAAEAAEVDLRLTAESPVPIRVDRELLAIAIRNLVSNALQYSSRSGSVDVRVGRAEGAAVLEIRDDGDGIPAEALKFVFERFYRADAARGRTTGAAGLGLSIVAEIVRHHGGKVEVTSESGAGAKFTVYLPDRPSRRSSDGYPS